MKYKTQDAEGGNNPFLNDVIDLLALIKEFSYALSCYRELHDNCKLESYQTNLTKYWKSCKKLAISLASDHKEPTIEVKLTPPDSIKDLKEKLYNMLKEIAKNALEENEVEVVAYLLKAIRDFEHYFCTIDEDDVSRGTSSQ